MPRRTQGVLLILRWFSCRWYNVQHIRWYNVQNITGYCADGTGLIANSSQGQTYHAERSVDTTFGLCHRNLCFVLWNIFFEF
jgi:hypothetical protein